MIKNISLFLFQNHFCIYISYIFYIIFCTDRGTGTFFNDYKLFTSVNTYATENYTINVYTERIKTMTRKIKKPLSKCSKQSYNH